MGPELLKVGNHFVIDFFFRNLSLNGKTIVCTIHQPSSQVFALFDRILLMAEGRVAYLGSTRGALDFFAR